MSCKEEFIEIFKEKVTRPGADALLNYLENKSDFFTAPASARYHLACEGGLGWTYHTTGTRENPAAELQQILRMDLWPFQIPLLY